MTRGKQPERPARVDRRGAAEPLRCPAEAWFPAWLGPAVLACLFVSLAWWSWRKWPDVQIDFGNQLYLPWQLSLGRTLYADIEYKDGPLSLYLNTLLFALFGVSMSTLVWCNLAILTVLCWLVYRIFRRSCGRLTATLAGTVQLGVFSFSQYTGAGNYNYVCPYTHEQTHGIILAAAMIVLLGAYVRAGRLRWCALAGGCLGLIFLTKSELFVPAAAAALLGLGLSFASPAVSPRRRIVALATFLGTALLPAVAFWTFFLARMPAAAALRAVAGNWIHLRPDVLEDKFYLTGMGLDDLRGNVAWMLTMFVGIGACAAFASAVDRLLHRVRRARWIWCPALGIAVLAALASNPDLVHWRFIGRALPLTSLVAATALIWLSIRWRHDREAYARFAVLAMWATYALVLLTKVVLNVRLSHYGFVLAMPATLLLVAALTWLVPSWLRQRQGGGAVAQALLVAPVLAGVLFYFQWSNALYVNKNFPVGHDGDTIVAENPRVDARAWAIALAEERLRALMPSDATLLVLPEGTILNYWLRRTNPTRHTLFIPSAIRFFGGEDRILRDIQAHPPDFIVLMHREAEEFGYGYFGTDPRYGRQIVEWVGRHYARVERIGAEPLRDGRFGILILRRVEADPESE